MRARQTLPVTWFSPRFIVQHASTLHVIVCESDGIANTRGDPRGKVPPKRLFNVDPNAGLFSDRSREDKRVRIKALTAGDVEWRRQIEVEQGATVALIFTCHDVIESVSVEMHEGLRGNRLIRPSILLVPPGDDLCEMQVLGSHEQLHVLARPMHM